MWLLFILLGLTNMTKGFVFGTTIAMVPIITHLLADLATTRSLDKIRRYLWIPGFFLAAVVALWWAVVCELYAPGSWKVWYADLAGRMKNYLTMPWHYYLTNFPLIFAPWFFAGFCGIYALWRRRDRAGGFVIGWAVIALAVLSIAKSKHHHYALALTGGWAILGAYGYEFIETFLRSRYPESRSLKYPPLALGGIITVTAIVSALIFSLSYPRTDRVLNDTKFLISAKSTIAALPNAPVYIATENPGSMDFFRAAYYLDTPRAIVLPDLSFLDDERYQNRGREIYVICRVNCGEQLRAFAENENLEKLLESAGSRRAANLSENFALYRFAVRENLTYTPRRTIPPTPNWQEH